MFEQQITNFLNDNAEYDWPRRHVKNRVYSQVGYDNFDESQFHKDFNRLVREGQIKRTRRGIATTHDYICLYQINKEDKVTSEPAVIEPQDGKQIGVGEPKTTGLAALLKDA